MGLNGGPLPIWLKHERDNQLEANEMSLIGLLAGARVCRSLRSVALMSTLILLAVLTYPVLAEDILPTEPLLRLNTDRHTDAIPGIATDAQNRFLVTASDDKTARVWSLPDGQLQTILRVPIADPDTGSLYAVAITPDGSTVALGGWTGALSAHNIYLFDRSGALKQRLSGLPDVILHLAYSKDGRHLAATLGGKNGIRVFDVASGATHPRPAITTTMIAQAGRTSMPRTGWSQPRSMASCACMRRGATTNRWFRRRGRERVTDPSP